jgi:hypothetical protein
MVRRAVAPVKTAPTSEPAPAAAKIAVGLKAFFRIMDAWCVDNESARILLGEPSRATFYLWKKGEVRGAPHDTVRRVSYVLGIYKALHLLFRAPGQADAWVKHPNTLLGGQSALERMCAGDVTDLAAVRALLDAARGGGV